MEEHRETSERWRRGLTARRRKEGWREEGRRLLTARRRKEEGGGGRRREDEEECDGKGNESERWRRDTWEMEREMKGEGTK